MDSLTISRFSSSLRLRNYPKTNNPFTSITTFFLPNPFQKRLSIRKTKTACSVKIPSTHNNPPSPLQDQLYLITKNASSLTFQLSLSLLAPFSCYASETETTISSSSDKINLESILVSIDDFFNRNPFFVAGVTFIWLVVIPLTQEYVLKKFKFIAAIDAFRKLRDDPNSQLLDIRDNQSLQYLGSPNLKILNKRAVQIQFMEREEEGFVKKVMENFKDPGNTTLCILDNFDGKSIEVAELLFKNGFKEAYAIKGGLRGKDGWQAIQETLLPPSVHVFPKKNSKTKEQLEMNGEEINRQTTSNGNIPSLTSVPSERVENGSINSTRPISQANLGPKRMSSPYPNYPDLKPPSSPTPSKPVS
ncbi:Rhodanese-like domain [Macleaya cordata]|uniref:Rhodanese-like domain n=1 Tax=Macleaya cordata TaxID=56857 RepID=A0A200QKT6_MACCD|nr:Rhodanese-like domain [Macleaya cordata]